MLAAAAAPTGRGVRGGTPQTAVGLLGMLGPGSTRRGVNTLGYAGDGRVARACAAVATVLNVNNTLSAAAAAGWHAAQQALAGAVPQQALGAFC